MALSLTSHRVRPMNIHAIGNSVAGRKYISRGGIPDLEPEALAPGLPSTPVHNLKFHGGKTIQSLTFTNFFVGSNTSWAASDISNIDHGLAGAMSEPTLNNVMAQYFAAMPTSTFRPSVVLPGAAPATMSQGDVEQLVTDLNTSGRFNGFDLTSTVFNFMLPRGTVLNDNPAKGAREGLLPGEEHHRHGVPDEDEADSRNGLGGYHGSVIIGTSTIYYAVGVFSETRNGQTNGIPVFDQPWKNVVATFYHELNEARTDPDVEKVIAGGRSSLLGWASRQGEECGDFPVFEANPLTEVFKEVPLTSGGTAPVQFQYSNAANGPEGPIPHPRPPARHAAPRAAVVA